MRRVRLRKETLDVEHYTGSSRIYCCCYRQLCSHTGEDRGNCELPPQHVVRQCKLGRVHREKVSHHRASTCWRIAAVEGADAALASTGQAYCHPHQQSCMLASVTATRLPSSAAAWRWRWQRGAAAALGHRTRTSPGKAPAGRWHQAVHRAAQSCSQRCWAAAGQSSRVVPDADRQKQRAPSHRSVAGATMRRWCCRVESVRQRS